MFISLIYFCVKMSKHQFHSHISCKEDKDAKWVKKGQTVEELVCSCYVNEIMGKIERKSKEKCNGCFCSFNEMLELFYFRVTEELKDDNAAVIDRFEEVIKSSVNRYYDAADLNNARRMLECKTHRRMFCEKNYLFFKETVLSVKE